jgi:hypothetical protein
MKSLKLLLVPPVATAWAFACSNLPVWIVSEPQLVLVHQTSFIPHELLIQDILAHIITVMSLQFSFFHNIKP